MSMKMSAAVRRIKNIFVIFSAFAIIYLLLTPLFLYENVNHRDRNVIADELIWRIEEDGMVIKEQALLPYYVKNKDTSFVDLYAIVPHTKFTLTSLEFVVYQKNVWVYLEEELLYERVFKPTWFNKNYPGSGICALTLPQDSEGKTLHIKQERVVKEDKGAISSVSFINGQHLENNLAFQNIFLFSLLVSLVFIAIVLLILVVLYRKMELHLMPLIYLAITIWAMAFWTLSNTKMIEIFTTNWVFIHNLEYISFYIIPLGFLSFIRSNWKYTGKLIRIMEYSAFVFFNSTLLLKIFFETDFYEMLLFFHIFMVVAALLIALSMIIHYKKAEQSFKVFAVGTSIASVCVILEVGRYYLVYLKYSMASFFVMGIVILSVSLVLSFFIAVKEHLEQSFQEYTSKNFEAEHKRYETLMSNSKDIFIDWNLLEGTVYISKQFEPYFGELPVTEDFRETFLKSTEKVEYSKNIHEIMERIEKGTQEEKVIGSFLGTDYKTRWFEASISSVLDVDNQLMRVIVIIKDITKEKELEAEYANQIEHIQVNNEMYDNILEADITQNRLIGENSLKLANGLGFLEETSYDMIISAITEQLTHEDFKEEYKEKLSRERILSLFENGITHFAYECIEKTDRIHYEWIRMEVRIFKSEISNTVRIISYVKNIEEEKQKEFALLNSSQQDSLTKLLHKGATKQKIIELLSQDGETQQHAFLMIDVDYFKNINDTMGHIVGDIVIQENAALLKKHFRESDIIGRIGGDEFAVLIRNIQNKKVLLEKCRELCRNFHYMYRYEDKECPISISVGVSLYPEDGDTYEELYQKADEALYETKNNGRNGFTFANKKTIDNPEML